MCKISQLAEKNIGQLAIRRAYRTGALFFIIRAYSFFILITCFILFTIYNYVSNNTVEKESRSLVEEDLIVLNASQNLMTSTSVRLSGALGYVLTGEPSYIDSFNSYGTLAEEQSKIVGEHIQSDEFTNMVEQARANLLAATPLVTEVLQTYGQTVQDRIEAIEKNGGHVVDRSADNKLASVFVSIIVVILGIIIAILTANRMAGPVNQVAKRMESLAHGNLSHEPFKVARADEIGSLMQSANEMCKPEL